MASPNLLSTSPLSHHHALSHAHQSISGLLTWDELVMMPPGERAAATRAGAKAALARAAHAARTDPEIGALLDQLEREGADQAGDAWRAASIREARRAFARATALPEDVVAEKAALESEGYAAWAAARRSNDFPAFAPVLERIVALERRVAALLAPGVAAPGGGGLAEPYDALLDGYEKGCTAARLDVLFSALKAGLIPLLAAVRGPQATAPDTGLLSAGAPYDTAAQAALCEEVAVALGFDTAAGRLDVSVHPFTGGAGPGDVRMTTRFKPGDLVEGLTGAVHETGHALYEQALPAGPDARGLPIAAALSMGAHESQSLLWERHVGLSLPFARWLAPRLGAAFPAAWGGGGPDPLALWRALNAVRAPEDSLVRVEADELTYPAHVLLRFGLERAFINGSLAVADIPAAWAEASQALLGVVPPTDTLGCLQDVHWGGGAAGGYFPTYLLGAAAAAQLWEAAGRAMPGLEADVEAGRFAPLRAWLREGVHERGSAPASLDALLAEATGGPLSVAPLLRHLAAKYGAVYQLPPGVADAAIAPGLAAAAEVDAGAGAGATATA